MVDSVDSSRWTPALRRAVMRVRPEYFTWSQEERERYGIAIPKEDGDHLNRILLKELFGVAATTADEIDAAQEALTDPQRDILNATTLPLAGIGEDHFFLNEYFAEGTNLLSFATVYDYDLADHHFQEDARAQETPAYVPRPYHGGLYSRWARLFVDEAFTYANLSMVAGYLQDLAEERASGLIDELIPHRYVDGENHGKRSGKGFEWDLRLDADGKEGLLDALRDRQYDYVIQRARALAEAWDQRGSKAVYIVVRDIAGESNQDFLFSDTAALKEVRFRSFLRDCRRLARPFAELAPDIDAERQAAETFIRAEHERLLRDFDPKIARLRKQQKIIVHEDAADKFF
jgi:hypothetical protein